MELREGFIVCSSKMKKKIIEEESGIKNYIFMSLSDLKSKLYGTAKKKSVFFLMKKYALSYDLALEYLKYMPYVDETKTYGELKIDSIASAKRYLLEENLYQKDDYFIYRLNQFPITFLETENTQFFEDMLENLRKYTEVILVDIENKNYSPIVSCYPTVEEEVYSLCNQIRELKNKGVSYNQMTIVNCDSDYEFLLRRCAKSYGIPMHFPKLKDISHTTFAKKLLMLLEECETFSLVFDALPESRFNDSILQIITSYDLEEENPKEYIDFFKLVLKSISFEEVVYPEMVEIGEITTYSDRDYVFYLGFNLGSSPRIYKNESYLSDTLLELLGMPTSVIKNRMERKNLISFIKNTKNLTISYKNRSGAKDYEPSSLLSELELKVEERSAAMGYSIIEDSIRFAEAYSIYEKIHEEKDILNIYDSKGVQYKTYDNTFKGLSGSYMQERFTKDTPLALAYSNLKTFYECPFKYYLDRILKISENESTTATRLGSYAHAVLEDSYEPDFDFSASIDKHTQEELENVNTADRIKDEFYFNEMKSLLSNLLMFNLEHESSSRLDQVEREAHVEYFDGSLKFHGYIDKLLYTEIDGEIYAAIIDYKSGKDLPSLDNVTDGYHLQLPSYMFLLSKYEKFKGKKIHIIGIYLQKINMIALDNTKDMAEQMNKNFKLKGFTVRDINRISYLDNTYADSSYIDRMKLLKDGSFYKYAMLMEPEDTDELIQLVDDLIHHAHHEVLDGHFPIAPKRIGTKEDSCRFCKFKDVCYKTYNDIVYLEEKKFKKEEK